MAASLRPFARSPTSRMAAAAVTAGVVAMTMAPTTPVTRLMPSSMNTVKPNMPKTAISTVSSQSPRLSLAISPRWRSSSGASTSAPTATRSVEPTKTGMASVTSLETGVAEPKRIMPAASWR